MIKPCRPKWKGTMTDRAAVQTPDALQTGFDACFNMGIRLLAGELSGVAALRQKRG